MMDRRTMMATAGAGFVLAGLAPLGAMAESPSVADIVIGEIERRIVEDYFDRQLRDWQATHGTAPIKSKKQNGLPPGLAKKGRLPPGLEKQLARNGHLPPGLEYRALPYDLRTQLPVLPTGYDYVMADNRVMLIQSATNLIMDVMQVAAIEALD
jgi:hypothetical protein